MRGTPVSHKVLDCVLSWPGAHVTVCAYRQSGDTGAVSTPARESRGPSVSDEAAMVTTPTRLPVLRPLGPKTRPASVHVSALGRLPAWT